MEKKHTNPESLGKNSAQALLEHKAYNLRALSLIQTSYAGSGHLTSCLSAADVMAALFFHAMSYDPADPQDLASDRFILSKGHAAPLLYAVYKELGMLSEADLHQYRSIHSPLEGHPTFRFPYAQAATGSLGMGLSIGVGQALAARLEQAQAKIYVLMGDSETAEGSVWEAVQLAAYYKLNNLVGIIDCNRLGQTDETMFGHHITRYQHTLAAFGWHVLEVDGHDMPSLMAIFDQAREITDKPVMIIAKTFKGYGIDAVENKQGWHGKVLPLSELSLHLAQLKNRFPQAASYGHDSVILEQDFGAGHGLNSRYNHGLAGDTEQNYEPGKSGADSKISSVTERAKEPEIAPVIAERVRKIPVPACSYKIGEKIATRKAYGQAITALGGVAPEIVVLDAEVKNSTFAEIFEQQYPERFFQCFIAEQNMVGMGVGFHKRGHIPFISTFGCFFTRAHDQIRMAVLGKSALRLVGSHVGVSIGQDGPSQMALEDIGMFRALPDSIVLYPCDAVSTHYLAHQMAEYETGISYMRTTRGDTPVMYDNSEKFVIGGCKILRSSSRDLELVGTGNKVGADQNIHLKDTVCVIAAGITVHEALKAHELLLQKNISISVIDLYSIKPFDLATVLRVAHESGNRVLTVEDHYSQGGIGEMVAAALCNTDISVTSLSVTQLPCSGKPAELLAWARIDAQAIVETVQELVKNLETK